MDKSNNKVLLIFKNIGFGILFVFLGLVVSFILMEAILPRNTLNVFQVKSYIAKYDTMEPTIKPYDLVFINKVDAKDLDPGDKVTLRVSINYSPELTLVTYYIHDIWTNDDDEVYFRIVSEGGTPMDRVYSEDELIGGYSFRIPYAGRVIEFIKSPFGIGAIVLNVLIISSIVVIVKTGKKTQITE
jgi:signal peptidase I